MASKERQSLPKETTNSVQPSFSSPQLVHDGLTANQRQVLALQRTQGNGMVVRKLGHGLAQRAPQVGWNQRGGGTTTSINKGETDVPVDAAQPKLGSARRIPVRGLNFGRSSDDAAGIGWQGKQVSGITKETAKDRQAIVILPDNLDVSQPVGVLLHLQGLTVGYRAAGGKVEDVDFARIEQQLRASGQNMIAILPQAGTPAKDERRAPDFGNIYRDNLIDDVFKFLTAEKLWTKAAPKPEEKISPTRGPLVYSAYSGGGFAATNILSNDISDKNVKAGNINPANMGGVILFDSIHDSGQIGNVSRWLKAQLDHDLEKLNEIAGRVSDAGKREAEQRQYLATSMRFRGIYSHTSNDYYAKKYKTVETFIHTWFTDASARSLKVDLTTIMVPSVLALLSSNYQVIDAGHGDHATVIGQGDPLKQALTEIPAIGSTSKSPAKTVQPSRAPQTATAQPIAREHVIQREPTPSLPDLGKNAAPEPTDPVQDLIDAAVALNTDGSTRLPADYIKTQLQNRSGNAELDTLFNRIIRESTGQQLDPLQMRFILRLNARDLIHFLEGQFIHDPKASTLDFLARGKTYRNKKWDRLDYPGQAKNEAAGPNEGLAAQMMNDLRDIEGERRPNTGDTAVISGREFTSDNNLRDYVIKQLKSVPDLPAEEGKRKRAVSQAGYKLNTTALDNFLTMREAAQRDNVDLILVSGYRSPETSKAASKDQNPNAIANYSSHNLGLAMDLQMSSGKQQYLETTTRPMQNITDMHQAPAHKWIFLHGPDYGWFPWHNEPWHWEYNPVGFRDKFQAEFQQWLVDNPPKPTRRGK
jgi:uncharacterized protein YcbK (DUF882 family)